MVENLFQRGLLKVVFATETLAAGVNMPARCSVMSALSKRGDEGPRMLTSNEFMQMCGRAGRRGYDTVGHVVCCQSPFEGCEEAFDLVIAPPENLKSQFSISYGMVLNLLRAGRPLSAVRSIVERSFGNYLGGRARREQVRELRRIREQSDALREQIATGDCGVEPEEWARFIKLDERLKEERRLLKIISRQTDDALAEMARANVRDALELLGGCVVVGVDVRQVERRRAEPTRRRNRHRQPRHQGGGDPRGEGVAHGRVDAGRVVVHVLRRAARGRRRRRRRRGEPRRDLRRRRSVRRRYARYRYRYR